MKANKIFIAVFLILATSYLYGQEKTYIVSESKTEGNYLTISYKPFTLELNSSNLVMGFHWKKD